MAQQSKAQASKAQTTRAFQVGQATGIPINQPLVDNHKIGSFWTLLNRTINTTDTVFSIGLGRTPTAIIVVQNQPGGVVHDGTAFRADWTPSSITLRATIDGIYGVLVG